MKTNFKVYKRKINVFESNTQVAFRIYKAGEVMLANNKGEIWRPTVGLDRPSGNWRVTMAVQRNNFGNVIRVYTLSQILTDPQSIPWRFKNGKQRVFIRDYDHGTHREWVHPGYRLTK